MKNVILALALFSSFSSYGEISTKCATSEGEVITIKSITDGKFGVFINRADGSEIHGNIIRENSVEHYVSKDMKTLKISFFKNLGLGTAKIDGKFVGIECTRLINAD